MKKNAAGKQKETGIRTQKQAYLFLAPSLIILTVFVLSLIHISEPTRH